MKRPSPRRAAAAAAATIAATALPSIRAFVPSSESAHSAAKNTAAPRGSVSAIPAGLAAHSPLFTSRAQRFRKRPSRNVNNIFNSRKKSSPSSSSSSSSTALHVLTTPASIFEETSTQNLLDDLLDESVRTSARRPVMMQFDPSSGWIWKRWRGTVFSETWPSVIRNMMLALCVSLLHTISPNFINQTLSGFDILWGQLLSVTTFTLTFFLNQSYSLWRKCYELSRRLQGRLNDLGMTMAAHAARTIEVREVQSTDGGGDGAQPNVDAVSRYTPEASQILQVMARYIRLFNLLTYASFTRSHRPILTPRGMRRMVERGLIMAREREVLVNSELPATQRHNAVLMWIIRIFQEGREAGHIEGGAGFEQQFMEKCHVIRAQYGAIGDELSGRMPLAYAHIVQVLVDVVLWMYPFMAISKNMSPFLCVLGTGLLTMFYQGLFDLAKQFLDPYDNENYGKGEDPLCIDTLVAETNSGSVRWYNGLDKLPFSAQLLQRGKMDEYVLPLRGFTVTEVEEMELLKEAERIRQEKEAAAMEAAESGAEVEEEVVYDEEQIADMLGVSDMLGSGAGAAISDAQLAPQPSGTNGDTSVPEDADAEAPAMRGEAEDRTAEFDETINSVVWSMEDRVEECLSTPDVCLETANSTEAIAASDAEQETMTAEEQAQVVEDDIEEYVAASAIVAAAEAEFLETEAILNAPPNADYLPEEDMEGNVKEKSKDDAKKEGQRLGGKKKEMNAGDETLLVAKGVMEIAEGVEAELEEKTMRDSEELNALGMDEIIPPLMEEGGKPNGTSPDPVEGPNKGQSINYLNSL